MITQDFEEFKIKKTKVWRIWLIMQVLILLNYILELGEKYMTGWLIKDPLDQGYNVDIQKEYKLQLSIIVYTNRAI